MDPFNFKGIPVKWKGKVIGYSIDQKSIDVTDNKAWAELIKSQTMPLHVSSRSRGTINEDGTIHDKDIKPIELCIMSPLEDQKIGRAYRTNTKNPPFITDISEKYKPQMVKWINKMFTYAHTKEWYKTYWAIDLHGTVIQPNFKKGDSNVEYYPYAKECLQLLSDRDDIIMFTLTSSYPEELAKYDIQFKADNINFDYHNENPEITQASGAFGYYKNKPYFNVFFDDKAGFDPETDWELVYDCLIEWNLSKPKIEWKN
jgi:hypothetical protein